MRHLDLFTGIGGFALAAQTVWGKDYEPIVFCEIDKFCQKVLRKHWPNTIIINDIKLLDTFVKISHNNEKTGEIIMAKLAKRQVEESVNLYKKGFSLQQIADYFFVSRQAMWDLLRRRIKLRPQKKYGTDNNFYRGGKSADDHAQNIVEYALRKKIIIKKEICDMCGKQPFPFKDGRSSIQAHHSDYNKPLKIMWLCQSCHHKWHKKNKAIRKEDIKEIPDKIDILTGGFP